MDAPAQASPCTRLPSDVLAYTFQWLRPAELVRAEQACANWCFAARRADALYELRLPVRFDLDRHDVAGRVVIRNEHWRFAHLRVLRAAFATPHGYRLRQRCRALTSLVAIVDNPVHTAEV